MTVTALGRMYIEREDADVTGYTRITLVEQLPYNQFTAKKEWVVFDVPLPKAKRCRAPSKVNVNQ